LQIYKNIVSCARKGKNCSKWFDNPSNQCCISGCRSGNIRDSSSAAAVFHPLFFPKHTLPNNWSSCPPFETRNSFLRWFTELCCLIHSSKRYSQACADASKFTHLILYATCSSVPFWSHFLVAFLPPRAWSWCNCPTGCPFHNHSHKWTLSRENRKHITEPRWSRASKLICSLNSLLNSTQECLPSGYTTKCLTLVD
jgi:hypothetical protein